MYTDKELKHFAMYCIFIFNQETRDKPEEKENKEKISAFVNEEYKDWQAIRLFLGKLEGHE